MPSTELEHAQQDYDNAVSRQEEAELAARETDKAVIAARKRLEQAKRAAAPPVDRAACVLADGNPVTEDHREINPATGQQKGYVVLTAEERAKGFQRPVRRAYIHQTCGTETRMSQEIAETYARDPKFYSGTFCVHCRNHFPVGAEGQFVWKDAPAEKVGT